LCSIPPCYSSYRFGSFDYTNTTSSQVKRTKLVTLSSSHAERAKKDALTSAVRVADLLMDRSTAGGGALSSMRDALSMRLGRCSALSRTIRSYSLGL
ncbi:hypothetical protein BAE44_0019576, partial [Dichanthelium oligosanthes]